MGAMNVGAGSDEEGGGETDESGGSEEEEGHDEERMWGAGGDEAAGRDGVRKREAEDGMERGAAPPGAGGLVIGTAAAGGGEVGVAAEAEE